MPSSPEPRPPDRPGHRERTAFLCVAAFFACCSLRLLTTGYLELDDLGRVQLGYNLWAADGRLLTAALMALLSFHGRLLDVSPLPQMGAIACMGAAGTLLARASPTLGTGRVVLVAILLFATPFYLQNMTYVFDSLSMTAAVVLALWAALLLPGRAGAILALLAALLLYQPAIDVFLSFAAAAVLLALARHPAAARPLAGRALLVAVAAGVVDLALIAALRLARLVVFPAYQARHAALIGPGEWLSRLPRNAAAMLSLATRMIPARSVHGVLVLSWLAAALALALVLALRRDGGWRRLPLFAAASAVLLSGFAGPMLLLRDPVVQPRTLLGVGGMLSAAGWLLMRLLPAGRAGLPAVAGAVLLSACFARDAFAYGALLRDLDRAEASLLPPIARALNAEQAATGLHTLQILGAMPYPPAVRRGLERAPGLAPLFDNPLDGLKWFGVPLLAEYGLEDGIAFRDADPATAPCAGYRETGPGYAVGHDARSLLLVFRGHCR